LREASFLGITVGIATAVVVKSTNRKSRIGKPGRKLSEGPMAINIFVSSRLADYDGAISGVPDSRLVIATEQTLVGRPEVER
jgi:hypothetical protein